MTDQTAEQTVRYTLDNGAAHIVMTRPAQLNAMTPEMVTDLRTAVTRAREEGARVLLISAEGRAFCAGRDIAGAEPGSEDGGQVLAEIFNPLMQEVADLPFPTIAAVQGACLGTGLGLALACDVVLAADNAKFGSPFGKIGAVFDSGGHKVFVERLGTAVTFDLIYSGRFLSGRDNGIVAVTLAMPDPKATVYAVVIGLVLWWLIERPNAAQRAKTDLSIIGDNTADIEAGDEHGVAPK